jgi:hypothetical protein
MNELVKHVENSISDAEAGKSKLSPDVLKIEGMSSPKVRHFLNNVTDYPDINYLEIGVFLGSTFVSALYGNKVNSKYAIDNWSYGNSYKYEFSVNCRRNKIFKVNFFEKDAFRINLDSIKDKINIYFYDGDHSPESSCNALTYYYKVLSDVFVFIVDDFSWGGVHEGVREGIKQNNLSIITEWDLSSFVINDKDGWWNGLGVFILSK